MKKQFTIVKKETNEVIYKSNILGECINYACKNKLNIFNEYYFCNYGVKI